MIAILCWHYPTGRRAVRRTVQATTLAFAAFFACSPETAPVGADKIDTAIAPSNQKSALSKALPKSNGAVTGPEGFGSRPVKLERIDIYGLVGGRDTRSDTKQSNTIRVVLWLDGQAPYRRGELPASNDGLPRRLFLDLEEVILSKKVASVLPVGSAGLLRIRSFGLDTKTTRVSFDVERATEYRVFELVHPYRIVMDFRGSSDCPRGPSATAQRGIIALDPGHGGSDFGAASEDGLKESVLTLDLAKRIKEMLQASLSGSRVVMTRQDNSAVSLEERTAIANGYGADLFVSIHFNASTSPAEIGGVATYILDTTDSAQALRLAAAENGITEQEVSGLQAIVASLYRKEQVIRSFRLATLIQRRTLATGRVLVPKLADRGTNRALFYVLIGARMPSVLVEASFITRSPEAASLRNESYRQALATGISRGIIDYINNREKP
jgi:N-acetylmuramoyl-L-alanine amidase